MSVRIIVDSTADTTPEVKDRLTVVPLTVCFGQEEYIDGVTIDHRQFYEKLAASDVLPTTSQATPATFAQVFAEVEKAGDSAVVITIAAKLSGTYQSALIAASDYDNIYVVDSNSVTMGAGILAQLALTLADKGLSAPEIAEILTRERENVRLVALLDTLEYLKKGGRISGTVAFVGGMLSIKPLIQVADGEIHTLGKARGLKQGNQMLSAQIEKLGVDFSKPLLLGYTGLDEEPLGRYIAESRALWAPVGDVSTTAIGSVIGTHAGPGAYAAAFFKE